MFMKERVKCHTDVPSGSRGPYHVTFNLSLQLPPYFVFVSSDGTDREYAHMQTRLSLSCCLQMRQVSKISRTGP